MAVKTKTADEYRQEQQALEQTIAELEQRLHAATEAEDRDEMRRLRAGLSDARSELETVAALVPIAFRRDQARARAAHVRQTHTAIDQVAKQFKDVNVDVQAIARDLEDVQGRIETVARVLDAGFRELARVVEPRSRDVVSDLRPWVVTSVTSVISEKQLQRVADDVAGAIRKGLELARASVPAVVVDGV